jgi:hypothetical protein
MIYYELLLRGGLKPSMFLRNFETKHNDIEYKPVEVFQEKYKEKGEIKKMLHHAATNSYNMNRVGVAYCIVFSN